MFLEVQLLSNCIDIIDSLRHLDLSAISLLLVDRIGRSLRFCYLQFKKEAIKDVIFRQPPVIYRKNAENR